MASPAMCTEYGDGERSHQVQNDTANRLTSIVCISSNNTPTRGICRSTMIDQPAQKDQYMHFTSVFHKFVGRIKMGF
jgi:hypothetical protein